MKKLSKNVKQTSGVSQASAIDKKLQQQLQQNKKERHFERE